MRFQPSQAYDTTPHAKPLAWVPGFLAIFYLGLLSALIWWGEEPSKLASVLCVLFVCLLACMAIVYASRRGVVHQANLWLSLFGIRLLVATIVIAAFWYEPDLSHRTLAHGIFDATRHDARGALLAKGTVPWASGRSYSSGGLVFYIAAIYRLFGISVVYVTWMNAILSLGSLLLVAGLLSKLFEQNERWDFAALGLLIPEALWYDSLALREAHTGFLIMLGVTGLYLLASEKRGQGLSFFCISLFGILALRQTFVVLLVGFSVVALLLLTRSTWGEGLSRGWLAFTVLLALAGVAIEPMVTHYTGGYSVLESGRLVESILRGARRDYMIGSEGSINTFLMPDTWLQRVVFFLPRTIGLMVTPFPRFDLWSHWRDPAIADWLAMSITATRVTLGLYLLLSSAMIAAIHRSLEKGQFRRAWWFVLPYLGVLASVANGTLMFHERWRVAAWPLWIGMILIGWPLRRQYRTVSYGVVGVGLVLFAGLKVLLLRY